MFFEEIKEFFSDIKGIHMAPIKLKDGILVIQRAITMIPSFNFAANWDYLFAFFLSYQFS